MVDIEKVRSIVKEITDFLGFDLVEIKFKNIPGRSRLEIYIDKFGGVSVEDCKKVSERISFYLDADPDIVKGSFNLIVSSPGIDRPLKTMNDFLRKRGRLIDLYLKDGRKLTGEIIGVDKEMLLLESLDGDKKVPFKDIKEGRQKVVMK